MVVATLTASLAPEALRGNDFKVATLASKVLGLPPINEGFSARLLLQTLGENVSSCECT